MFKRSLTWFALMSLTVAGLLAQGQSTTATKDDWEEINFETSSAVLTDGYPSLLRLAELLTKNPGYKVRVEGHTDGTGSKRANEKLGMQRAQAVKSFLEKYGARPDQITATTQGMGQPKVGNDTKEGRWMNRRTMLYVADGQGRPVSAGGVGDAIRNLNAATGGPAAAADPKCCDEILKRLDKLDDILALLRTMKGDHDKLAGEVAKLKEDNTKLAAATAAGVGAAGLAPAAKQDVADVSRKVIEETLMKNTSPKWSILGANAGVDNEGRLTFTGKGRYFAPIGKSSALQSEAEYMYFRDRQEGQFDAGLVQRFDKVQMGLFSSFKHATFSEFRSGGTLGQGALAIDYIFKRGRLGVFGTKAFLNNAVVNRAPVSPNVILETYMRAVDQIGGSTSVALWKDTYVEGNLGFLRAYGNNNKPGGMVRFVQPLNKMVALSIEGGLNETLIGRNNSGSVRFGVLFGNWLRPKDYATVETPVPMDIPRVRYELLTRRIRTGNSAPIADAGGDQFNTPAGNIRLDGSASYDPDGDPITFQWQQVAGPTVALTNATQAVATFTAAAGQTYAFRLTVKDDQGAQGVSRATVTSRAAAAVRILRFQANPVQVRAGQPVNLLWLIENADSATISPVVGAVNATQGTTQVSPNETTTYRLTARNATSEAVETVTVNVERPLPRIISFQASPATINRGQGSTLAWQTENADTVTVSGVGTVNANGTAPVSPADTTTYTITATNQFGSSSATAVIQVGTPPTGGGDGLPRIIRFTAAPMDITAGDRSSIDWLVENATNVTINSLGSVGLQGNVPVSPTANTLYTITASNAVGQVTSTIGINVRPAVPQPPPAPTLTACVANPVEVVKAGDPASISYTAQNATVVTLNGLGVPNPVVVRPTATTTYTLIAYNAQNQTARCEVTVRVAAEPAVIRPTANAGPSITTIDRLLTLDGTKSSDPSGGALTYRWRPLEKTAVVLEPNSPTPRVQLGEQFGPYTFELTVTNGAGVSATSTVTINYALTRVR
ncbi:MAG: OmpA family protein [Bryobacterales bacterium]|nr:OmpA family protein [Bryobacterales bacterium]